MLANRLYILLTLTVATFGAYVERELGICSDSCAESTASIS